MNDLNMVFAGFGGQGVLFSGKVAAYVGLLEQKEISWLPSYGPEMRGGTANCSVCISDRAIGAPLVSTPNVLVAMNLPSLDKFIDAVEPGGIVVIDSSLVKKKVLRDDIRVFYVPASEIVETENLKGLSNMVLIGKLFHELKVCEPDILTAAIEKSVPESKRELFELNCRAVALGAGFSA